MLTHGRKLHFFVYDRTPEVQRAFEGLLSHQLYKLGGMHVGQGKPHDPLPIQVTVVKDQAYLGSSSIAAAVNDLGINAIVSPGNSLGFMEGGFDLAINLYYGSLVGVNTPVRTVTLAIQKALVQGQSKFFGYNPVHNVERIPAQAILDNLRQATQTEVSRDDPPAYHNRHNVPDLLHVPTMAVPSKLQDTTKLFNSVVFNCVWSLLAKLAETHLFTESDSNTSNTDDKTLNIMITGLGTGVGALDPVTASCHMFYALFHYGKVIEMLQTGSTSEDVSKYFSQLSKK